MTATTIIRPYANLESPLHTLQEELIAHAARLEEQAYKLESAAEYNETAPPKERINRLRDQAATLRYKSQIAGAAARVCGERGTAAETVGMGYVLPAGYTATREETR